ncbi:DUF3039 domain-containing protein [Actinomyces ruminicola]|uniref:DUF3039 domain-containing protein n=1 Tax=Actinomyces ruminicola TaxID=332524 RepID=UPI0016500580|nr:DUF3039 domain-containing protein [Actinomyces ruminicola]
MRTLKMLPAESYSGPIPDAIRRSRWKDLADVDVSQLPHPLIEAGKKALAHGADRHVEATAAAGRPVFELRTREGAAWRGAMIIDDDGTGWIVYAQRHDRFHSTVAGKLTAARAHDWMPRSVDHSLRKREQARAEIRRWRVQTLAAVIGAAGTAAVANDHSSELLVQREESGRDASARSATFSSTITVSVMADLSEADAATGLRGEALLDVAVVTRRAEDVLLRTTIAEAVTLLAGPTRPEAVALPDGSGVYYSFVVPASRLQWLVAVESADEVGELAETSLGEHLRPTHLHYTRKELIAESAVEGRAVRALCGEWFVVRCDEGLPVCEACETRLPVARLVAERLR